MDKKIQDISIHMHTYVDTHIHTGPILLGVLYIRTYVYVYMCVCVYVYMCVYVYVYVYVCMGECLCICLLMLLGRGWWASTASAASHPAGLGGVGRVPREGSWTAPAWLQPAAGQLQARAGQAPSVWSGLQGMPWAAASEGPRDLGFEKAHGAKPRCLHWS